MKDSARTEKQCLWQGIGQCCMKKSLFQWKNSAEENSSGHISLNHRKGYSDEY